MKLALKIFAGFIIVAAITIFGLRVYANSLIVPITPELIQGKVDQYIAKKHGVGIIVAHVTADKTSIYSAGETKVGNKTKPNENTIFEMASNTKAMTGVVLAKAISEGLINDQDLAQKYLKNLNMPSKPITVAHLATHSSGIPRIDMEFFLKQPEDELNPYVNYALEILQTNLPKTVLEFEPGTGFTYSNTGAGLIGIILENVYNASFENLMMQHLFLPLGMHDTVVSLNEEQRTRLAQGYTDDGTSLKEVVPWDFNSIPAAGALRSSVKDQVAFTKAVLEDTNPISIAFKSAIDPKSSQIKRKIGYFWISDSAKGAAWHAGATYGMQSFIAIRPDKKSAIIVFANSGSIVSAESPVTDLGIELARDLSVTP